MKPNSFPKTTKFLLLACTLALVLSACGGPAQPTVSVNLPTPAQVVPTQPSAVALVNGEAIPSNSFATHVAQYQAAQTETGTLLATDDVEQVVLDDLVNRLLLAQGARVNGFVLDKATIDQRLSTLVEQAGGQAAFDGWLTEQGFTAESFRLELALEIEAGWMRAEITAAVPQTAEQVLARQIFSYESFQAERLLGQLQDGTSFEQVARNNDPQGLGNLGWFPRGYLLQPEVEEAAFALQPGEYSQVVQTSLGFHLIEVLDRDPDRPLSPQARLSLQLQALADWLEAQRAQSTIENLLP